MKNVTPVGDRKKRREFMRCPSPNSHPAIKVRYITDKFQLTSPLFSSLSSFGEAQVLESARKGHPEVTALEKYQYKKAALQESIERLDKDIQELKEKKKQIPHYLAIQELPEKYRFAQLARRRKHFLETIKMIAYRAETALVALIKPEMSHVDEARAVLHEIFTTEADLIPEQDQGTLTVALHHLANPISCQIACALAVHLN